MAIVPAVLLAWPRTKAVVAIRVELLSTAWVTAVGLDAPEPVNETTPENVLSPEIVWLVLRVVNAPEPPIGMIEVALPPLSPKP
jgi:hypothetical protein